MIDAYFHVNMIEYKKYTLPNGLILIVHRDTSTPIAAVNMLYKVGARNEDLEHTGFAHLFEHLMFGGSRHIPIFDEPIQLAGGESNAFTNNDYTNYYITLPKENIETALWLESDRMLCPNFTQEGLDTQKSVVIEEFNQRYRNQPYGDVWLELRPLAYKVHPYRWATIGKNIEHIANATLEEVNEFFDHHYTPGNAVLSIVADMDTDEIYRLVEKWFGDIPARPVQKTAIPQEPVQTEARVLTLERNVSTDAIYKAYHLCDRFSPDYYVCDMLTDLLSSGKSSRLYRRLVQEKPTFMQINAYISGDIDNGLLVVCGHLLPNIGMEEAEATILSELNDLCDTTPEALEVQKSMNKIEAMQAFSETQGLNKAINLAYYEMLDNVDLINTEVEHYQTITAQQIQAVARKYIREGNCSTLYYKAAHTNE